MWHYEQVLYMIARLCLPMRLQSESQLCLCYVQYARCLYAIAEQCRRCFARAQPSNCCAGRRADSWLSGAQPQLSAVPGLLPLQMLPELAMPAK